METWLVILLSIGIPVIFPFILMVIEDYRDWFTDELPLSLLFPGGLGLVASVIVGFIFWIWWIMLIILIAVILLTSIGIYIFLKIREKYIEKQCAFEVAAEELTNYNCPNCGGKITRKILENAYEKKSVFSCDYCGISHKKRGLINSGIGAGREISLSDFETEYFDFCHTFSFKPQEKHTIKQVERRYEKLEDNFENFERETDEIYECGSDVLERLYNFFADELFAINKYIDEQTPETIKNRFDYYVDVYLENDDDDDE